MGWWMDFLHRLHQFQTSELQNHRKGLYVKTWEQGTGAKIGQDMGGGQILFFKTTENTVERKMQRILSYLKHNLHTVGKDFFFLFIWL